MEALQGRQRELLRELVSGNVSEALLREGARQILPVMAAIGYSRHFALDDPIAGLLIAAAVLFGLNLLMTSGTPRERFVLQYPAAFAGMLLAQDGAARTLALLAAVAAFSIVTMLESSREFGRALLVGAAALGVGTTISLAWLVDSGNTSEVADDVAVVILAATSLVFCLSLTTGQPAKIAISAGVMLGAMSWAAQYVEGSELGVAVLNGFIASQIGLVLHYVVYSLLARGLEVRIAEHLVAGLGQDTQRLNFLLHQHVLNVLAQARTHTSLQGSAPEIDALLAGAEDRIRRLRAVEASPAHGRIEEVLHACARSVSPQVLCRFDFQPSDVDLPISNDEAAALEWIVDELFTNAAKHARDKAGEVIVTLGATRGKNGIELTVQDSGAGFTMPTSGTLSRLAQSDQLEGWVLEKLDTPGGARFSLGLQRAQQTAVRTRMSRSKRH